MAAELPKQIGRYRIETPLAATEKSILLAAHDPSRGESVALQLFGRPFVSENFLATLHRDARRLSHLRHKHLLPVYGAGVEQGHAFLVTALPPAHQLTAALSGGPLSPTEAEEVITAVAAGLDAIHDAGLLHTNLSPETIFINEEGEPLIGGYCPMEPQKALFAAPEQQQSQPLSRRTDVYSLGMLLLYLLSGRSERSIASMAQLPVAYQDVVRKATAAASLARFNSATELVAALPGANLDEPAAPLLSEPVTTAELPEPPSEPATAPLPDISQIVVEPAGVDPEDQLPDLSTQPGPGPRLWLPLGLGLLFICLALGALGWYVSGSLLASATPTMVAPTLHPTAIANVTATPTPAPTATNIPTATPIPSQISINSPANGTTIDLGQAVQLDFTLSDPSGIRTVNVLANGQLITSFNAGGVTSLQMDDSWVPNRRGSKLIEVVAVNRLGDVLPAESTTIQVIDQALLARYNATWNQIERNVSQIRGLQPLAPVFPDLMSRAAYRQRSQQQDIFYSEAEAQRDVILLHAFDFVPLSFDLYGEYQRYNGDNVAGFYNIVTKEFIIITDNDEMDTFAEWTYAHEYMHALQDQHFDLEELGTAPELGYEAGLALRSLVEGEAELVQQLYLDYGYFTQAQLVEIYSDFYFDVYNIKAQAPSNLPPVLVNLFWFPYTTGADFVTILFEQNGWAGVTAAWQNLPTSSEQIIHPFRYLAGDAPRPVTLPDLGPLLPAGYTRHFQSSFGEFYLREYLSQQLPSSDVDQAATGWGGDQYAIYLHENQTDLVMVLRTAWDTPADAAEFLQIYPGYATAAYGSTGRDTEDGGRCWTGQFVVCLYSLETDTLIIRAPTQPLAQAIMAALR